MTRQSDNERLRQAAREIFAAGVAAVDGYAVVQRALRRDGDELSLHAAGLDLTLSLRNFDRVVVLGAGKASARMARAVEDILGRHVSGGLVVVKHGYGDSLRCTRVVEAGHPVPDDNGVRGARDSLALVDKLDERALVVLVLSGGGSALWSAPPAGVSLTDMRATTQLLLAGGADIAAINCVRKHLSTIKGGQLAQRARGATIVALLLSDVIGDAADVIASGPVAADPTTFADARAVLRNTAAWDAAPPAVRAHIDAGVRGEIAETPKADDPCFAKVHSAVVGNNQVALDACLVAAQSQGFVPTIITSALSGEARQAGQDFAIAAREVRSVAGSQPRCLIAGGETTVTVHGDGCGGRNQELCVAAMPGLAGLRGVALLSAGTDGTDGPTDAAGGFAFGDSMTRAAALGLSVEQTLARNDSHTLLERLGDLLVTGPTGTNVMDIQLLLVDRR